MNDLIEQPVFELTEEQRQHVLGHLKYYGNEPASEAGIRVGHLLHCWDGLHHFDPAEMKKAAWSNPIFVRLKLKGRTLSSFDFDNLTALVFLAHDQCIRVEITHAPGAMEIYFHPRNARDGGMCKRHPTLEQAVEAWRRRFPLKGISGNCQMTRDE